MHTLIYLGLKFGLVVICGWVFDRGWLTLRPPGAAARKGLFRYTFFLLGMAIGVLFLISDIHYSHLFA